MTGGQKKWSHITSAIRNATRPEILPSDRFHAVFVRPEDAHTVRRLLSGIHCNGDSEKAVAKEVAISELDYTTGLYHSNDMEKLLESSKATGTPAIVIVNSADRAIDLLGELSTPIKRLAVLGPESTQYANYIQNWLPVELLSDGFIYAAGAWAGKYGNFSKYFLNTINHLLC